MFPTNPSMGAIDPRLLPMMQSRARGLLPGPVPQQQLTPGFRSPPLPGMSEPSMQVQQPEGSLLGPGMATLGMGLGMMNRGPNAGVNPGVPTPKGDPTGGAGPAFLGGTSPLGNPMQPVDPATIEPTAMQRFLSWLKG